MKPYSIYFPQFHPSDTNDQAWGKGFTDWSLVSHANLHERWHRRAPHRGYYNGADPAVHAAQMHEMVQGGLGGIGLYHYWFYSHQELPTFERTMLSGKCHPALQWFLIWASESWSRRWLGDPSALVTLTRNPTGGEIQQHVKHLLRCFEQPQYLKINDRPLFVWYHLDHFDRPGDLVTRYRDALARHGVDPLMGQFIKSPFDVTLSRFVDVSYLFEPRLYFGLQRAGRGSRAKWVLDALHRVAGEAAMQRLVVFIDKFQQKGQTFGFVDYLSYLHGYERRKLVSSINQLVQEVVSPGWNNTPRYDNRFTALEELPAEHFGRQVAEAAAQNTRMPVLINAWNEWSEGAAIEPCAYFGTRYLDTLSTPPQ